MAYENKMQNNFTKTLQDLFWNLHKLYINEFLGIMSIVLIKSLHTQDLFVVVLF